MIFAFNLQKLSKYGKIYGKEGEIMKFTGVSRPIDELGRIVIPKEIRTALELSPKDEMEIYIENGSIILKKSKTGCAICGSEAALTEVSGKPVCADCIKKIQNLGR